MDFAISTLPVVRRAVENILRPLMGLTPVARLCVLLAWIVDLAFAQVVLVGTALVRRARTLPSAAQRSVEGDTGVGAKADFSEIRYSQVWEDTRVLRRALRVSRDERVLSIASAGDNVFGLLLDDPREVIAIDLSQAQLALCALKIAAIRHLSRADTMILLGFNCKTTASTHLSLPMLRSLRLDKYSALRLHLDDETKSFWDSRLDTIASGIIHAGRLEWYFRNFSDYILPLVRSRENIDQLFAQRNPAAAFQYFVSEWDGPFWRIAQRAYFSRALLGIGRDPAFFEHVSADVGTELMNRFEHAIKTVSTADNFYLEYMMTGNLNEKTTLPDYLTEEGYKTVRERLGRVKLVRSDVGEYLAAQVAAGARKFDAFNLSDIFEWMNAQQSEALLRQIVAASNKGARIAYWNLFVPRWRPESMANDIERETSLASDLKSQDRTFMYGGFQVERVI